MYRLAEAQVTHTSMRINASHWVPVRFHDFFLHKENVWQHSYVNSSLTQNEIN